MVFHFRGLWFDLKGWPGSGQALEKAANFSGCVSKLQVQYFPLEPTEHYMGFRQLLYLQVYKSTLKQSLSGVKFQFIHAVK